MVVWERSHILHCEKLRAIVGISEFMSWEVMKITLVWDAVSVRTMLHISWNTGHIIDIATTAFREAEEHKTGKQLWPSLIGHAKKWVLMKTGGSEKSSSHGNCGINHSIPYVKQNMFQPSTYSTLREYIWTVDRIYSAHFQNVTIVAVGQFIHMTLSVKIETWLELQLSKWESSKSGL